MGTSCVLTLHMSSSLDGGKRNAIYVNEGWVGGVCGRCGAVQAATGIGLEQTLGEWVENVVPVMREVRRVLRDDGTVWLNLGDAYAGSGKGLNADGTHSMGGKQDTNIGSLTAPVKSKRMPRGQARWGGGDSNVPDLDTSRTLWASRGA